MKIKYAVAALLLPLSLAVASCGSDDEPQNPAEPEQPETPSEPEKPSDDNKPAVTPLPEYDAPDRSKVAAFPGALGAGMYTTGGAGGTVYTVTSLADDGTKGTLRWAINQKGPRTIVFAVGGVISLKSRLQIKNDDITIAGQTAPAPGICLKNYTLNISANNVIIRYIRCRMGDEEMTEDDSMNAFQSSYPGKHNIIVDHCSLSWSTDECGSFYGNTDMTLQWCILSESLKNSVHGKGSHGYGGIWGGSPATFHHNLLAHHSNRTPRICGSRYSNRADMEKVDLINNVVYNWTSEGAYGAQGGEYNMLNNYYKPGPATANENVHCRFFTAYVDDGTNNQQKGVYGYFYLSGNEFDMSASLSDRQKTECNNGNADNFASTAFVVKNNEVAASKLMSDKRFDILPDYSFVQDAKSAYADVLSYAGASNIRDAIDARIVKETKNGVYTFEGSKGSSNGLIDTQADVESWDIYEATKSDLVDTDGDGMPDVWEEEKGLDPKTADGAKYNLDPNYTNLEVYLNSLVADTFPAK